MEDIKFRGLDKNKRWVYGFLSIGMDSFFIEERHDVAPSMSDPCGDTVVTRDEIDPKTIGQYIGIQNGIKLYEGDIIEDHNGIGVIEYAEKYAGFRVNYKNGRCKWFYDYLDSEINSIVLISNIHLRPELIK